MSTRNNQRVCPVEHAGGLDNKLRRIVQNPRKILVPYLKPGMTALDMGCGPGYFTLDMAKLVSTSGKVIAVDLQQGMLDKVDQKIKGTQLEKIIQLHQCGASQIGLQEQVDFALAFYMVHEVPNQTSFFQEIKSLLNPKGRLLIVEPNFHVSKQSFNEMTASIQQIGFKIVDTPRMFFSRAILLEKN